MITYIISNVQELAAASAYCATGARQELGEALLSLHYIRLNPIPIEPNTP